jgi:hypothetical protein
MIDIHPKIKSQIFQGYKLRYVIFDEITGKILDDANGYGYKTEENARKIIWYKFKGGKQKIDIEKAEAKKFWKTNPKLVDDIQDELFHAIKERREYSDEEIVGDLKKQGFEIKKNWLKWM